MTDPEPRRSIGDYLRNLPRAHRYLWWFARAALLLRRPARFLLHYLRRTSPEDRSVELRDGTRIELSGHPHDVITLFVIFVREDYGRLAAPRTVVDVGANIGAFSLYAARAGAQTVLAYEPNAATFGCLLRNVAGNRLEGVIRPQRLAVAREAGASVRFPAAPSAYNRIGAESAPGGYECVATTSLARILERDAPQGIDLLKLDCEGAEYDILLGNEAALARVGEIRMEYHDGREKELVDLFGRCGFRIALVRADGPANGTLWARRAEARR